MSVNQNYSFVNPVDKLTRRLKKNHLYFVITEKTFEISCLIFPAWMDISHVHVTLQIVLSVGQSACIILTLKNIFFLQKSSKFLEFSMILSSIIQDNMEERMIEKKLSLFVIKGRYWLESPRVHYFRLSLCEAQFMMRT